MISFIKEWVLNISLFLIVISFIEQILPRSHFQKYIKFFMGFLLMIILITPLQNWLTSKDPLSIPIFDKSLEIEKKSILQNSINYKEKQQKWIVETYKENLKQQIGQLFENKQSFTISDIQIKIIEDINNSKFGEILQIQMNIFINTIPKKKKFNHIYIEKIRISQKSKEPDYTVVDNEELLLIKDIKNTLSNFYNMSDDNIYITIQKK